MKRITIYNIKLLFDKNELKSFKIGNSKDFVDSFNKDDLKLIINYLTKQLEK